MTLEARPIRFFSLDFSIEAEGQRIALFNIPHWGEAGTLSIEGQSYELHREGLMSGAFLLENAGQTVARAIKPSAFRPELDLEVNGCRYSLKSSFSSGFSLYQKEAVVGRIHRAGMLTRRVIIELPSDWSVPLQVFVFWLAFFEGV